MDISVDQINPFLNAAVKVFEDFLKCELRKGHLSVKESPSPEYDVALIIGITGDYVGQVVYSMKRATAEKIVEILNPDVPFKELANYFEDTLGEVANMITGNATIYLNKMIAGTANIDITTPSLITGDAFELQLLQQTTIGINMYSPFGTIEINVAIKRK